MKKEMDIDDLNASIEQLGALTKDDKYFNKSDQMKKMRADHPDLWEKVGFQARTAEQQKAAREKGKATRARPEVSARTSRNSKEMWQRAEFRAKMAVAQVAASTTPEQIERAKKHSNELWASQDFRKKMTQAKKEGSLKRMMAFDEEFKSAMKDPALHGGMISISGTQKKHGFNGNYFRAWVKHTNASLDPKDWHGD